MYVDCKLYEEYKYKICINAYKMNKYLVMILEEKTGTGLGTPVGCWKMHHASKKKKKNNETYLNK